MSGFICPGLISVGLAGSALPGGPSLWRGGGRGSLASPFCGKQRVAVLAERRAGREAVARLWSLNFILYANANLPLNWEGGMVERGGRRMLVGSKDAVLFSCGLYSEERKVCFWSSSCWSARCRNPAPAQARV